MLNMLLWIVSYGKHEPVTKSVTLMTELYVWMGVCLNLCLYVMWRMHERKVNVELYFKVYSTKNSHYSSIHIGAFTVKDFKELGCRMNQNHTYLFISTCRGMNRQVGGAWRELLGIGRAAKHLADSLGDGITIDAIDLEQLMRFATARNVGHCQTMHIEARLIDHGWGHCLPKATYGIDHITDENSIQCNAMHFPHLQSPRPDKLNAGSKWDYHIFQVVVAGWEWDKRVFSCLQLATTLVDGTKSYNIEL